MYPSKHFIYSLIFCIILFPFLKYWTIVIFLSGTLIDVDHYLYYILKFKDWSFRKAYHYHVKVIPIEKLHIFHTIEFYLLCFSLVFFNLFFVFIFLGISFHMVLDILDMKILNPTKNCRAASLYRWVNRH